MYKEIYNAKVELYDEVERHTIYTSDEVHGSVGQYYNTRVPVVFDPEQNIWVREISSAAEEELEEMSQEEIWENLEAWFF